MKKVFLEKIVLLQNSQEKSFAQVSFLTNMPANSLQLYQKNNLEGA